MSGLMFGQNLIVNRTAGLKGETPITVVAPVGGCNFGDVLVGNAQLGRWWHPGEKPEDILTSVRGVCYALESGTEGQTISAMLLRDETFAIIGDAQSPSSPYQGVTAALSVNSDVFPYYGRYYFYGRMSTDYILGFMTPSNPSYDLVRDTTLMPFWCDGHIGDVGTLMTASIMASEYEIPYGVDVKTFQWTDTSFYPVGEWAFPDTVHIQVILVADGRIVYNYRRVSRTDMATVKMIGPHQGISFGPNSSSTSLYSGSITRAAQSFIHPGDNLDQYLVAAVMTKTGSPTGNFWAELYTHAGTLGESSVPDTLLATSSTIAASTLSTSASNVFFTFPAQALVEGTPYVLVIRYESGNSSNKVNVWKYTGSSTPILPGNSATYISSWIPNTAYDFNISLISTIDTGSMEYTGDAILDNTAIIFTPDGNNGYTMEGPSPSLYWPLILVPWYHAPN